MNEAMKEQMAVDPFKKDIIKVFSETVADKRNKIVLWVVKWATAKTPVLEKRRLSFSKEKNDWNTRKQVGLNAEDIALVCANAKEIETLLSAGGTDAPV